jgi:hypothetical protein
MMIYLWADFGEPQRGRYDDDEDVLLASLHAAVALGQRLSCGVQFKFQGYTVRILPDEDPMVIVHKYLVDWGLEDDEREDAAP